jgi:hypothetical protein
MRSAHKKIFACSLLALSVALTGCLTDDDGDDNKGGNTDSTYAWASDTSLSVGAQANTTLGTAVDLDVPRVLLSAAANQAQDSIDVLFAFHNGSFRLLAPRTAKDSAISVANNYDIAKVKYTQFVKVTGTAPATWTAGVAAFTNGTPVSYASVAANDVFVVKTTLNNYVLLTVTAITGTDGTGAGTFNVKLKGLLSN